VNAKVPENIATGEQEFRLKCAGVSSNALSVAVRIQSSSK